MPGAQPHPRLCLSQTASSIQTIDYAGKQHGNPTNNGTGKWAYVSALNGLSARYPLSTLRKGTVHLDGASTTNSGLSHSIGPLTSTGSNTRSILFGNATVTIKAASGIAVNTTSTGMTLLPGTSIIVFSDTSGNSKTFAGGGLTWNNLQCPSGTGGAILSGSNTFNQVTAPSGGKIALGSTSTTTIASTSNTFTNGTSVVTMVQQSTGRRSSFRISFRAIT